MRTVPAVENLGELFECLAHENGDAVALRDARGNTTTYGAFHARTLRLCAAVSAAGVEPGARIAVLSKNRVEFAETFGLVRQGLVIVPLNWRLGREEIRALLADCRPEAIFVDRQHHDMIRACPEALSEAKLLICYDGREGEFESYDEVIGNAGRVPAAGDVSPLDPLCIIYTSGTTGLPKGAVLSHEGVLANMRVGLAELLQIGEGDRVLAAMPFFHVGGLWYHFFAAFASGCETTILPEFCPKTVLDVLENDRITVVHLVPTMIAAIVDGEDVRSRDLAALRRIFYAGSPMPGSLLRRAMALFENCDFLQSYGSTEAGIVSALRPEDHRRALDKGDDRLLRSCGMPVTGCEVRIAGEELASADGGIGEIEVRSAGTALGYWNNPNATGKMRAGDWVRTGDLGHLDDEGFLFLVDRKNDMIVTGGENVFPAEVEEHLARLDGVKEAAVFGIPHPRWVEQVTAVVVPLPGSSPDPVRLVEHLRGELAHYKCPKQIFFAETLPKNGVGKVLRARLREQYRNKEFA